MKASYQLNLRLSEDEMRGLNELASRRGQSPAATLRGLIPAPVGATSVAASMRDSTVAVSDKLPPKVLSRRDRDPSSFPKAEASLDFFPGGEGCPICGSSPEELASPVGHNMLVDARTMARTKCPNERKP